MKILVVKLSSMGDILHLFPAISDLHRHVPEAEIHWLVEPAFAEVVKWHLAVDKVITAPLRAYKKKWWRIPALLNNLQKQLRAENYDMVLDAQGLIKSALLARLAGSVVSGFSADCARESLAALFYTTTAKVPQGLPIIVKNRQLISKIFGLDISQAADFGLTDFRNMQMQAKLPDTLRKITDMPYVVFLHGTTWDSKYWPESSWIELMGLLTKQGWRCLLPWSNETEYHRIERIQKAGGEFAKILPKLSLTELMGVLLHASAFISVESGIGHLAAALDIPGIMLHGPTDPAYSGILGKKCEHISSGIYCSPCFKRNCPRLQTAQEVPPCQAEIKPIQVYLQCMAKLAIISRETAA